MSDKMQKESGQFDYTIMRKHQKWVQNGPFLWVFWYFGRFLWTELRYCYDSFKILSPSSIKILENQRVVNRLWKWLPKTQNGPKSLKKARNGSTFRLGETSWLKTEIFLKEGDGEKSPKFKWRVLKTQRLGLNLKKIIIQILFLKF